MTAPDRTRIHAGPVSCSQALFSVRLKNQLKMIRQNPVPIGVLKHDGATVSGNRRKLGEMVQGVGDGFFRLSEASPGKSSMVIPGRSTVPAAASAIRSVSQLMHSSMGLMSASSSLGQTTSEDAASRSR